MRRRSASVFWGFSLLVAICIVAAKPGLAMTLIVREDADLLEAADAVVHATVIDVQAVKSANGRVNTHIELQVQELWKGKLSDQRLTLVERGGMIEGTFDWVPGIPEYRPGQEVVVFAVRNRGNWSTLDAWSGAFEVVETRGGNPVLLRAGTSASIQLYRVGFEPFHDRPRDLFGFRRAVLLGFSGKAAGDYFVQNDQLNTVNDETDKSDFPNQKWTPLYSNVPYRWNQFDSGSPEPWYYGNDPQIGFKAGNTSGDGPQELTRALATWVNDAGSNIHLAAAGRHTPHGSGWAGGTDGKSEVLFNDPYNEIGGSFNCSSGGTLAFGGAHGVTSPSASFRGSSFYSVVEGDVVFQDWPSDCSWLDSESLSEVIAHEVGHALVFGHSYENGESHNALTDDALMRWQAHGGDLADQLGEDDKCVAYWLYPRARVDSQLSPNSAVEVNPATVSPNGTAVVTVTLHDGTSPLAGQVVRGSIETTSGSASGALALGNSYPNQSFQDHGNGSYTSEINVGAGIGELTIRVEVNCCDASIPAPPYACDSFSPVGTLLVSNSDQLFSDGFETHNTDAWSDAVP